LRVSAARPAACLSGLFRLAARPALRDDPEPGLYANNVKQTGGKYRPGAGSKRTFFVQDNGVRFGRRGGRIGWDANAINCGVTIAKGRQ